LEDIDELRQFIDLVATQHHSQPSDANVCSYRYRRTISVGTMTHRAELVDAEDAPESANTFLPEEDRPRGINPDCHGYDHKDRREKDQPNSRAEQIERSFDHQDKAARTPSMTYWTSSSVILL
jgi:hypothetical protein